MSDLVQRLRNFAGMDVFKSNVGGTTVLDAARMTMIESADRIEALEAELDDMSNHGKAQYDELGAAYRRIEELEAQVERYERETGRRKLEYPGYIEAVERIEKLEAALREISRFKEVKDGTIYQVFDALTLSLEIARRALENKE